jgi:hypothetical protein
MRRVLILAALLAGSASPAFAGGDSRPRAVVELFTSQGCSSCPEADRLLGRLAEDPDLVALSFPVTYWDYLGWKDTLARPEFTERQRAYAGERRDRAVYTPQLIVNGRDHVVGSDRAAIDRAIDRHARAQRNPSVPIELVSDADTISVKLGGAAEGMGAATLWLVQFDRRDTVEIGRGENQGRQITYTNVVRQMQPIGRWKGQPMSLDLPARDLLAGRNRGIALLLQTEMDGRPGAILGAATLYGDPDS